VAAIKKFAAGGKACVISTLNGDTNVPFFKEFANAGLTSENCPVVSFSISEDEFRGLPAKTSWVTSAAGPISCPSSPPENTKFVNDFLGWVKDPKVSGVDYKVTGVDPKGRVTCSPMNLSRMGVYLWKQAVEKAD
jgi:urea transport system substrate-binding protein